MDMKMNAQIITDTSEPIWDVNVVDGIVPIVSLDEENLQTAILAGFLEKGTIPQLPEAGVPWQDFLLKKISFGELDSQIRSSINLSGVEGFFPDYEIKNDTLTLTIRKNVEA